MTSTISSIDVNVFSNITPLTPLAIFYVIECIATAPPNDFPCTNIFD